MIPNIVALVHVSVRKTPKTPIPIEILCKVFESSVSSTSIR